MLRPSQMRLALAIVLGVLATPAIVRAAGDVSVVLTAQRVAVVDGKVAMLGGSNIGDAAVVKQLAATLPVPNGMEYLPKTGAPQLASLDGKNFSPVPLKRRVRLADGREVLRDVPAGEYRWLRWTIGTLAPSQTRTVTARVRVAPISMAVNTH